MQPASYLSDAGSPLADWSPLFLAERCRLVVQCPSDAEYLAAVCPLVDGCPLVVECPLVAGSPHVVGCPLVVGCPVVAVSK